MSISAVVRSQFAPNVRRRGDNYFRRGRVRIVKRRPGMLAARVEGTDVYTVEIELSEPDINYCCTCPFFTDWGGPCKHVWAVLLKADDLGILNGEGSADDLEDCYDEDAPPRPHRIAPPAKSTNSAVPAWKKSIAELRAQSQNAEVRSLVHSGGARARFPSDRRILYLLNIEETADLSRAVVIELATQNQARGGEWDRPRKFNLELEQWMGAPEEIDRIIAQMLVGANAPNGYHAPSGLQFAIPATAFQTTLRTICQTQRCGLRKGPKQTSFSPLVWDSGGPWDLVTEIAPREAGANVVVRGYLVREEQRLPIETPRLLLPDGLVIFDDRIAPLRHFGAWPLAHALRKGAEIQASPGQAWEFVRALASLPRLPRLELHPSMQIGVVDVAPIVQLTLKPDREFGVHDRMVGTVAFDYSGHLVGEHDTSDSIARASEQRLIRRDHEAEQRALVLLQAHGFRQAWQTHAARLAWTITTTRVREVVMSLMKAGWTVLADGAKYRRLGRTNISVSSGIDWFEMQGGVEFDGALVPLPKLLAAVRRGENTIKLDDGSVGLLSDDWLGKYAQIAGLGDADDGTMRFSRAQIGFLDALLATMPEARVDETFESARKELRSFERIEPVQQPEGFVGELRAYQRDGLGWLEFLQRFSFGGCLADDMGLGKTVQVLALLESRRAAEKGPSLVVVPRSLVFNWKSEARRFSPQLRVLDHTGITRTCAADHFSEFDLIITTYGTLRRDARYFKDVIFDYAILDESQAIKNASTEAAKATRLLRAHHRLALSGTPIENRLTELWSLFEFLNPGMLGAASVFRSITTNGRETEGRQLLARALRPFILRRTKAQVAKDLPEKLEQTIHCDLEPAQRKLYNELREHYRQALLGHVDRVGLNRSKIQVLEALLRLRQAACHPGLIDQALVGDSSAKLETLLTQLEDVLTEGHKALVFSQFTKLLAIVRKRLDDAGTTYEYLDGKTRDRQARVDRFQKDQSCKLFLVSLKAGGVGLNLTAADYVFLLDPWWNPAVEAQAIDRTHRIGQTRRVFAYRLIARDTVEEKVLQLQQTKRDLADAIITADNSLISSLKRDDLELLLS